MPALAMPAAMLLCAGSALAQTTYSPKHGSFCGAAIDWVNELQSNGCVGFIPPDLDWYHEPTGVFGKCEYGPNPFIVEKRPILSNAVPRNMASPYLESADLFYKKLDFAANIIDDFHASLFTEAIFQGPDTGPVIFVGRSREGLAGFWNTFSGFGYATENRDKDLPEVPIDLFAPTDQLVNRFLEATWRYAQRSGTHDGDFWRGGRTVASGISPATRREIHKNGADIVRAPIGYIFDDMLDQNNRIYPWGWRGTTEDIDDIRCDGLTEFAYENSGARLWGGDSWWNLGAISDDNYSRHNNSWDGSFHDYSASEESPMVQAACGGLGDGTNSKAVSRDTKNPPDIRAFTVVYNDVDAWIGREVWDMESDWIYEMTQVQELPSGEWRTIYNNTDTTPIGVGRPWGRTQLILTGASTGQAWGQFRWTGKYKTPTATGTMSPIGNYKFRYVAVDQGGNVAVKEYIPRGNLSGPGQSHTANIQAFRTGLQRYRLTPPPGADFDVFVTDIDTGFILASGTQGGSAVEDLEFFVRENQRYSIQISAYSGSGNYVFEEGAFSKAKRYKIDQLFNTNEANGWQVDLANLPAATGWAIAWSRWADTSAESHRDLDMQAVGTNGAQFTSSGITDYELILTRGAALQSLTVFDYFRGSQFPVKVEAKNVFFLWQIL
jgi:hypothetical protein